MRHLGAALLGVTLLVSLLPATTQAKSEGPMGVPLLWYVVHVHLYPEQNAVPGVDALTCTPFVYSTFEEAEAEAEVLDVAQPMEWLVVQAVDLGHAIVQAFIDVTQFSDAAVNQFVSTTAAWCTRLAG